MASKTIKGLTVEIGGDTTKLGQALKDVEAKSRNLSKELGDINKLLKMDPGNTELLAQKQKVLADAVAATREKLDTLKEAEKQVQKQFEKGDASEEQLRALQREIVTTENKMKGYEKAIEQTAKAMDGMGDEADGATGDTKKLKKGSDDAEDSLDKLAKSADKAGDAGEGMGTKLAGAAKTGVTVLTTAVGAILGALTAAAEGSREYRAEMGKLDTAFTTSGHSTEAASKTYKTLQGILGETDQAVEASNHLAKLCDNEKELATWTDIATGVYATFGDSLPIENLTEAANETAKTGAITGGLADALNWAGVSEEEFQAKLDACSTEQERQALITETLNGLYSDAAQKYRETNAEVIRANEANEAWAASLGEVGGAVEPIMTDIKLMGASLLSDFVPGVKEAASALRSMINGDEGGAEAFGQALSGMMTQLLNKVVELAPTLVQAGMSLITSLVTTLISMLPQLVTTGVQLLLAIMNGLTTAIPQIVGAIVGMIPRLVQALVTGIPQLIQGAVQLFLAILQAIPQLIPPLVKAIPTIVMAVINALLKAIPQLIDGALTFLLAIVDAIPLIVRELVPAIPKIVTTVIMGLLDCIPQLLSAAVTFMLAIVKAIPQICVELIKALPQIWATMSSYFKQLPGKLWNILKSLVSNITRWGTESRKTAREGAKKILTAIVDIMKQIPAKMKEAGKNLVQGLWKGINGAYTWLKNKIKGWVGNVTKFMKKLFGINSPSRVTAYMGEMLDEGFAVGIEDAEDAPLGAMQKLSEGMLDEADAVNGLTLERRLNHTFAPSPAAYPAGGMLEKLDKILAAIERGQVLTIDGKVLVGATASSYDSALGQRRDLVARGAL